MAKKLEEIKEEECPYELPEGWKWERLGNVAEVVSGGTPSSKVKEYYNGDIVWITPADLSGYKEIYISRGAKNITKTGLDKSSAKLLPKDTVLLSSRAPIGYVAIARNELSTNQGFKNFLPSDDYLPQYLYWYLKGNKDLLESYASGTTFLELSASKAKLIEFPLAPKETQQKIVDIIESLFDKLDVAQEKVEQVLLESDNRRAAILHNAFSGKLTEKWRKENGVSFDSWKKHNLQDVCSMKITDGTHKTPTYCDKDEGIPFISSKDVVGEKICWDNIKYITKELHEELYRRLSPQKDDVLLAKNGTTGVAAIVEDDRIFDIYVTLAVLRPKVDIIIPNFLLKVVNSPICKQQFNANLTGIGVPNLHLRDIKGVIIPLPTTVEQKEIVRLLDKFISVEDKVKYTCQNTLESIATMRKSILAKAFRGELCS